MKIKLNENEIIEVPSTLYDNNITLRLQETINKE